MEIFCQKLIVSNVISAFLDYLKPKTFFASQPEHNPFPRSLDPPLVLSGIGRITRSLIQLRHFHFLLIQINIYFVQIPQQVEKSTNLDSVSCWVTNSKEISRNLNWYYFLVIFCEKGSP